MTRNVLICVAFLSAMTSSTCKANDFLNTLAQKSKTLLTTVVDKTTEYAKQAAQNKVDDLKQKQQDKKTQADADKILQKQKAALPQPYRDSSLYPDTQGLYTALPPDAYGYRPALYLVSKDCYKALYPDTQTHQYPYSTSQVIAPTAQGQYPALTPVQGKYPALYHNAEGDYQVIYLNANGQYQPPTPIAQIQQAPGLQQQQTQYQSSPIQQPVIPNQYMQGQSQISTITLPQQFSDQQPQSQVMPQQQLQAQIAAGQQSTVLYPTQGMYQALPADQYGHYPALYLVAQGYYQAIYPSAQGQYQASQYQVLKPDTYGRYTVISKDGRGYSPALYLNSQGYYQEVYPDAQGQYQPPTTSAPTQQQSYYQSPVQSQQQYQYGQQTFY